MHTDYLTTTEAAKICHVTRFTVLNWVKKHKLESTATLGGHQRIPRKAVLDLVKKSHSSDQAAVDLVPNAVQKAVEAVKEPAVVGAFLVKQKAKIDSMVSRGAFASGKVIAAFAHKMVKPGSEKKV
ncbi:MAG: helix-turn-helix domain-containing protein [Candidatus Omnitrophota bacterium]